jgi:FkbM family methyltransferase
MSPTVFTARIPLTLDCPEPMRAAVAYVFEGEYESGYDGEGLDILDIGANVGAFARWAELRWPHSRVRCYEPNPGTFAYLLRNTELSPAITCINAALYPGVRAREPFVARWDGDGEAGLATYAGDTFAATLNAPVFEVDVIDPATVAPADIVKIDVEGGEGAVLAHLDLSPTALVLLEFQNGKNRVLCRDVLARDFDLIVDESHPWDPILDYKGYRADLEGDVYGRIFALRKGTTRLRRRG